MRNKSIILSIVAVVLIFGTMIAGCKRDNRTAMNTRRQPSARQQRQSAGYTAGRDTVRPAEVLSAATPRRAPNMDGTAYLVQDTYPSTTVVQTAAYASAPAPMYYSSAPAPAQTAYVSPAYSTSSTYSTYYPEYAGYTGYTYSQPEVVNTPELAVAKASLPQRPVVQTPPPAPKALPPIPELEPVRYRAPAPRTGSRPAAEIMMSSNEEHHEVQRALAPIGPAQTRPAQGWVASPTTAMRF